MTETHPSTTRNARFYFCMAVLLSIAFPLLLTDYAIPSAASQIDETSLPTSSSSSSLSLALDSSSAIVVDSPNITTTITNSSNAVEEAFPLPLSTTTNNTTVTVTVLLNIPGGWRDYGMSLLFVDFLARYGNLPYQTRSIQNFEKNLATIQQQAKHPCLLVSNIKGLEEVRTKYVPHCRTFLINDEWCKFRGGEQQQQTSADVRFYYHEGMELWNHRSSTTTTTTTTTTTNTMPVYLPLGPRYDFWDAFQKIQQTTKTASTSTVNVGVVPPISQRRYIFNAIFSKSTSPSRKLLKLQLNASQQIQDHPHEYVIRIAGVWRRIMHPTKHMDPYNYTQVLLNSKFTLSPTGHNPECFRIFEAIIAGSIPVIIVDDEEYQTHKCGPNSLQPLLESSRRSRSSSGGAAAADDDESLFVILKSWTELEGRIQELLRDPVALDRRQVALQAWYEQFMRDRVLQLEALLLQPRGGGGGG